MELTQPVNAQGVVVMYRQVVASVSHLLAFGVPDALLTHTRDEIRHAVQGMVHQMVKSGVTRIGDCHIEELRAAYQSLASFVPYEEANAAARLQHALERDDYAFLATPHAEAATRLSRRIEQDASRMAQEFDSWMSEATDPVLTEINAMLAELEQIKSTRTA